MRHNHSQPLFVNSSNSPISMDIRLLAFILVPVIILCQSHLVLSLLSFFFICLMIVGKVTVFRWTILVLFSVNILIVYLFGRFFLEDFNTIQLSKTFACITLMSWFGSGLSWPSFKRRYLSHKFIKTMVNFIDQGVFHGQILLEQIQKRFDALHIRMECRTSKNTALAIGGGIATALQRVNNIAEASYLRTNQVVTAETVNHVSLKQCSLSKGEKSILTNISMDITAGDWFFLGGASGSGKTTLLKLISGLVQPSSGKVQSQNISLGFIFQNPDDQFFATTPREDILWGLEEKGIEFKEAQKIAIYWLKKLGIINLADRSLAQLSFGEKKRVAFASSLALKPKILLCDEPTSGLDFLAAKNLIQLLEDISREQEFSVIWTSHDLALLPKKISKGYLLKNGSIIFNGSILEALSDKNLTQAGLR